MSQKSFQPSYIVIHTAAYSGQNCDANMINHWHKARGWDDIGYHFVILNDRHGSKKDGTLEHGRSLTQRGAHTLGLNSRSIGICCIGHGDKENFTNAQYLTLLDLIHRLMSDYSIALKHVIGHREINDLIRQGVVNSQYKTTKTCPGRLVDMDFIRSFIHTNGTKQSDKVDINVDDTMPVSVALNLLAKNIHLFGNAQDELNYFLNHPEVIERMT